MKAVILIGGEATRLRPLTCNTPKVMVPVLNAPFLEHVVSHLRRHRVTEIVLAIGQKQQSIESYFGDSHRFGVRLHYSIEDVPLGTGGAVKNAEKYLDEAFLVLNGDIFTDLDISAMIEFHRERKARVTIAGTRVEDPTSYGLIETDDRGRITCFREKPQPGEITTNLVNAGTYILEPDILTYFPPQTNYSFERGLFPSLLESGEPLYAYDSPAYWIDIGTPEKYFKLHQDLLGNKDKCHNFLPDNPADEPSSIHPTTRINGEVLIGGNCAIGPGVNLIGPAVIGPGCVVGAGATIRESIIWRNTRIGERATVAVSLIANDCQLHPDCSVSDGTLLGDNVVVPGGCQLKAAKIWPGEVAAADT